MSVSAQLNGDGRKYLRAAQRQARALLYKAGVSSDLISKRCTGTLNHCCVQVSKLLEEPKGRRGSGGSHIAQLSAQSSVALQEQESQTKPEPG